MYQHIFRTIYTNNASWNHSLFLNLRGVLIFRVRVALLLLLFSFSISWSSISTAKRFFIFASPLAFDFFPFSSFCLAPGISLLAGPGIWERWSYTLCADDGRFGSVGARGRFGSVAAGEMLGTGIWFLDVPGIWLRWSKMLSAGRTYVSFRTLPASCEHKTKHYAWYH